MILYLIISIIFIIFRNENTKQNQKMCRELEWHQECVLRDQFNHHASDWKALSGAADNILPTEEVLRDDFISHFWKYISFSKLSELC